MTHEACGVMRHEGLVRVSRRSSRSSKVRHAEAEARQLQPLSLSEAQARKLHPFPPFSESLPLTWRCTRSLSLYPLPSTLYPLPSTLYPLAPEDSYALRICQAGTSPFLLYPRVILVYALIIVE